MIAAFSANELVWRFGWMLLHSLWQIALIGLLLWTVLRLTQNRTAKLRYGIACAGLTLCYLPLIYTFTQTETKPELSSPKRLLPRPATLEAGLDYVTPDTPLIPATETNQGGYFNVSDNDPAVSTEPGVMSLTVIEDDQEASLLQELKDFFSHWVAWLVAVWAAGVGLLAVWNLGGWLLVQRLRRRGIPVSSGLMRQRGNALLERMRIRRSVKFLESLVVEVPVVIGWLKPVVLLPAGLLTSLTPDQLEAVIAHELAHIRRHDYLINLLQTLTESLLFYHPVVWWLSHRIRVEREYCCDDEAIAVLGDRQNYVTALATVETARLAPAHALSLAGARDGSTLSRMRRLMGIQHDGSQGWLAGLSTIVLLLCLGMTVGFSQSQETPGKTTAPSRRHRVEPEAAPENQQPPAAKPADGANVPFTDTFQLDLNYYGESGKPYYSFTLGNNLKDVNRNGFHLVESADNWKNPDQVCLLVNEWLHRSGFFQSAQEIHRGVTLERTMPAYYLKVKLGNKVWEEDLGFDLGTLLRLESLQKLLTRLELKAPRDPDSPFALELLLSRISGYKRIWMEGQFAGDLKLQVRSDENQFLSGTAIPIKVELKNSGTQPESYERHILSLVPSSIHIFDEFGRRVPYVGGTSQIQSHEEKLAPGATVTLDQFDLAQFNYLRRPGHYLMYAVHGNGIRSNNFVFDISPNPDATTDFVGPLLPLVRDDWMLIADPNFEGNIHPGRNFSKVEGFPMRFQCSPTGSIRDLSHVWLFFTKQRADPLETPIEDASLPETRYYGQAAEYHLYAYVDEASRLRWQTVLREVRHAIERQQRDLQWNEQMGRISSHLEGSHQDLKHDPISLLIRKLEASHGLWMNGAYPEIKLPGSATPREVLAAAVKMSSFDKGKIEKYRVVEVRKEVTIAGVLPQDKYAAVRIESDQGVKILLLHYEAGTQIWWTRFYDPPPVPTAFLRWGRHDGGVQIVLSERKAEGTAAGTRSLDEWETMFHSPRLALHVRNVSQNPVSFIPHIGSCRIEWDGTWYVWGSAVAWGGPATVVSPGKRIDGPWTFVRLSHNDQQGWISERNRKPLDLTPGKHSIRVELHFNEGQKLISQPLELTITKAAAKLDAEQTRLLNECPPMN